ncbi:MAG: SBBP repeat-containing protein [Chitinophagales bacterium]|nr:SBBP repeat-containing protein [Chitinophagaceae bacterium]MCB9065116.1 SBBP repeat-containing protein [Chitinophagales bacterium]
MKQVSTKISFLIGLVILLSSTGLFAKNANTDGQVVSVNNETNLSFLENNGQITDPKSHKERTDIDFSVKTNGMSIFLGNGKLQYQWVKPLIKKQENFDPATTDPDKMMQMQLEAKNSPIATYRVDVTLVGANTNAKVIKEDADGYFEKYYIPNRTDEVIAKTYNKITYKNVYPNIDWVLYSSNNQLKYDFIVHKGGNPNDIKLKYDGVSDLTLQDGALRVKSPLGEITEQAPYSYLMGSKEEVTSSFKLDGNILSFNIEPSNETLVIDPFLDWATYHGGTHYDWGSSVTTDYIGNIYMAGWTYSPNAIATSGAFQDTLLPNVYNQTWWYYNGYIAKFNDTGKKLWGTYYPAFINALTCDGYGNLYATGWTDSIPVMATSGCHQDTFGGRDGSYTWYNGDAFISKFNSNGSRIWSTYYGGESYDGGSCITFDPTGYIYVGGHTNSKVGIATKNSHLDTLPPKQYNYYYYYSHGWVAKFNTNGVRQWGTYYTGMVTTISVDNNGDIAFAGTTFDTTGIATTGAYQPIHAGMVLGNSQNNGDGFIAKFNSSGVRLWGTYYGGQIWDWLSGIDHDAANNIYVTGSTYNDYWLATPDAYNTRLGGGYDAHLAKFSSTGARIWATYFGGQSVDWGASVKVSPLGKVYINGTTASTDSIASPGSYQSSLAGSYDIYLAEFDTSGTYLWGTYFGGPGYEYNWGGGWGGWGNNGSHNMDASVAGKLYTVSATYSTTGIATPNAHQTTMGGSYYDGFLAAFVVDTLPYVKHPFTDTFLCAGDTIKLPYGVTFPFRSGNTFTMQLSDASGSFASPVTIGTKSGTTDDTMVCVIPENTATGAGYRVRVIASIPGRESADNQIDMKIFAPPSPLTTSSNTPICVGSPINLTASHPTASNVVYSWTGPNSFSSTQKNPTKTGAVLADTGDYILTATTGGKCSVKDTTTVVVNIIPEKPSASSNSVVCPGTTLSLYSSSTTPNVAYSWTGPNSFASTDQNPAVSNATYGMAGTYYVTASRYGCVSSKDSVVVAVAITTPTPTASSNTPICSGQTIELYSSAISGATYNWTGPNTYSSASTNTTTQIISANNNAAGWYKVTATVNGCISLPDSVKVDVNTAPEINIYPSPGDTICVGNSVTFVSIGSNGGTTPQYQWTKNGIPITGANSATYSTGTVSSGDFFNCLYTSTTTCSSPATDTSIAITMFVRPIVKPEISIKVSPDSVVNDGDMVTFTATTLYGGKNPQYQWKRNGSPIQGATGNVWGTQQLTDGDVISVDLVSNDPCTQPKDATSNSINMKVLLSVGDINELRGVHLFPNPNNGLFTLKGDIGSSANELKVDIINAVGQLVYSQELDVHNGQVNKTIDLNSNLASGVYMLRINSPTANKIIQFTIQR